MNEKKNSKLTKADKIIVASMGTFLAGVGVTYAVYTHKSHVAYVEMLEKSTTILSSMADESITLIVDALKK